MPSIREWLTQIDLVRCAEAFEKNGIGLELLHDLTNQDLREIGIERLADRKHLLEQIEQLSVSRARASVERRLLSVLFCDMVGSTALATEVDPEELRNVLRQYQDTVSRAVTNHGGFVARYMGDGVLAYFGWPYANEDQTSQALLAGLEAVVSVRKLKLANDLVLHCRVGIATGRVVVGGGSHLDSAIGETPNLAARLQALAEQDQVFIDKVTRNTVRYGFETKLVAQAKLKGFGHPVEVWHVVEERKDVDRFEARHGRVSDFVGRTAEMERLLEQWTRVRSNVGQNVVICGESGIGKSRLIREFVSQVQEDNPTIIRFQCSPDRTNSAFYPVIRHLEKAGGIRGDATPKANLKKLSTLLARAMEVEPGAADIIADLLSIERDGADSHEMSAVQKRASVIRILMGDIVRMSRETAVLLVIEDTHWIDPSSRELLEALIQGTRNSAAMIVSTMRPIEKIACGSSLECTVLTLSRLSDEDIRRIAKSVMGPMELPGEFERIVALADGVPLFVEEVTSAALDHEAHTKRFELPETLEASLTARLDLLGIAKKLAQVGSVLGRDFKLSELSALVGATPMTLQTDLASLVASGLLMEMAAHGETLYRFKHALVRDVAYETLLKQERRELHKRLVYDVLTESAKRREPEVVAHHLTEAGLLEEAIQYWRKAGLRAATASANAEAIAHFSKGLELIERLPGPKEHEPLKFGFYVSLTGPLIASKGYTSEEFKNCVSQALALSQRIAYTPEIYPMLYSRWAFLLTSGSMAESRKVAIEFSDLAERQNESDALLARYRMLGASRMCLGELDLAAGDVRKAIELYDPTRHARLAMSYGVDIRVAALCFQGEILWLKGNVDQARESVALALEEAKAAKHLNSISMSLFFCGLVSFLYRDDSAARAYTDELMHLATGQSIGAWPILGRAMWGWANIARGGAEEELTIMCDGVSSARKLGVSMFMPIFLCRIADVMLDEGRISEAERYVEDAEALVSRTGEVNYLGELYRLRAELHRLRSEFERASALYSDALKITRNQNAKSVELRVATSFAQFLEIQREVKRGTDILKPIYLWFQEGHSSPDFLAAQDCIKRLSTTAVQ